MIKNKTNKHPLEIEIDLSALSHDEYNRKVAILNQLLAPSSPPTPTPPKTEDVLARLKLQKLEDLKLQIMAQNPGLLGVPEKEK